MRETWASGVLRLGWGAPAPVGAVWVLLVPVLLSPAVDGIAIWASRGRAGAVLTLLAVDAGLGLAWGAGVAALVLPLGACARSARAGLRAASQVFCEAAPPVRVGLGDGTNINVPLPGGSGDDAYLKAFREILVPAAHCFRPDLILVSAGFDADPLDLAMNVSPEGFRVMTRMLQQLADEHCQGRLAFVLEGGYHLHGLSRGARTVLSVLAGAVPEQPGVRGIQEVAAAAAFHAGAFVNRDDE